MKLTSAGANKMIKAWNEDLEGLLKKKKRKAERPMESMRNRCPQTTTLLGCSSRWMR